MSNRQAQLPSCLNGLMASGLTTQTPASLLVLEEDLENLAESSGSSAWLFLAEAIHDYRDFLEDQEKYGITQREADLIEATFGIADLIRDLNSDRAASAARATRNRLRKLEPLARRGPAH